MRLNAVNCLFNVSTSATSLVQLLHEVTSAVHTSTAAAVSCSDEDGPGSADGTGVNPAVGRSLRDPIHVNTTRLQFTVFSNSVKFACGCSLYKSTVHNCIIWLTSMGTCFSRADNPGRCPNFFLS